MRHPAPPTPDPSTTPRVSSGQSSSDVVTALPSSTLPFPSQDRGERDDRVQDSRSTSSTSSPAPVEYEESDFFLGANDSQSSLGVPNLQDMQVTDDECLPPVNRLPNEILISVFQKLGQSRDLFHCMLTCKRWARNAVDHLWHRPACTSWAKHTAICNTLGVPNSYFAYRDFIKRLNLAALADKVNDGSVMPLAVCTRVERLTLTNCQGLTDVGLMALVENSPHLLALDISGDKEITEESVFAIAKHCRRLQGLNISSCEKIAPASMIELAKSCRYIKRLKLNGCTQLNDEAISAFAEYCPNILEIDLQQCRDVGNDPVTALLSMGQSLRELRLANCELVNDAAFLSLPQGRTYEHLRILDLTSCAELTDRAVEKIVEVAPRLRNLVLAKCRNITDAAVYAIARLGKNLHYVHLGHCGNITDDAVKRLVQACNRIRYIDLGCCQHLTDDSVTRLAQLPKLKRIGLVKCSNITDDSVLALAKANHRVRARRDAMGNMIPGEHVAHSSLERVHLSYCTNLTLSSIVKLLNCCPRLTHLSLTGVQAFLRPDLESFCRDAPPEFTEHQRSVFCVFSGQGVLGLRRYLNTLNPHSLAAPFETQPVNPQLANAAGLTPDGAFDDPDADVVDDDDGLLEDGGSEMVIDTGPLLGQVQGGLGHNAMSVPPPPPLHSPLAGQFPGGVLLAGGPGGYIGPVQQQVRFADDPLAFAQVIQPPSRPAGPLEDPEAADGMDAAARRARERTWATIAAGPSQIIPPRVAGSRFGGGASVASGVGGGGDGQASTAGGGVSVAGGSQRRSRDVTPYTEDAEASSGSNTPDEA